MKKTFFVSLLLSFIWACSNNADQRNGKPENDIDAATMFIRSALNGQWKEAQRLIVQDSANIEDLEAAHRVADKRDVTEQRGYRTSEITVHDTRQLNDSVSIIVYSNTFKNQLDSVKAVRVGGDWLVDLKYSFPNNKKP